jgi:hypothetical protein
MKMYRGCRGKELLAIYDLNFGFLIKRTSIYVCVVPSHTYKDVLQSGVHTGHRTMCKETSPARPEAQLPDNGNFLLERLEKSQWAIQG